MGNLKPWEVQTGLQEECLIELAQIIKKVRDGAFEEISKEKGDGKWSTGCRAYERIINILGEKAKDLSWLRVERRHLYCLLFVNDVPLKFWKGDPVNPTRRILRVHLPEVKAREQLLLDFEDAPIEQLWRLCIVPDKDGNVLEIELAQYDLSGNRLNPWLVPLSDPVTQVSPVTNTMREGVELKKPVATPRTKDGEAPDATDKEKISGGSA